MGPGHVKTSAIRVLSFGTGRFKQVRRCGAERGDLTPLLRRGAKVKPASLVSSLFGDDSACLAGRLLPLVLLEVSLAEADRGRGDFDELVVRNEFECCLEGDLAGRLEENRVVGAGRADVRELLPLGDVDLEVAGPGVLSDDHALVDRNARLDEEGAALLEVPE